MATILEHTRSSLDGDIKTLSAYDDARSIQAPSTLPSHRRTVSELDTRSTRNEDAAGIKERARKHTLRVVTAFMICFAAGWGDGVTGVVLPYIKLQFVLSYTTSALLFVAVSSGYVITPFTMERATNFFGRFPISAKKPLLCPVLPWSQRSEGEQVAFSLPQGRWFVLVVSSCIHAAFFLTSASSTTFTGVLAGFFMNGFAKGNMISSLNAYMVANPHTFGLGHMHSFFCIGALTSPLVCQTLIARGWQWQWFYYISTALPVVNLLVSLFTFRSSLSEFLGDRDRATVGDFPLQPVVRSEIHSEMNASRNGDVESPVAQSTPTQSSRHNLPRNMFAAAIKTPAVLAFGFFSSMYTGSEGVTSGYIVTYLLKMKNADPAVVGYANSGAAVGRLALGFTAPMMGRFKSYWIFVFVGFAISFHLCIWLIPSFTIGWGMTALAGAAMGPVFPLALEIASRTLSPAIISSSLAIMSSMANLGGAFYPFLTGLLSNANGEKVIEPLIVSLLSTLLCFWAVTRSHFSFQ